MCGPPQALAVGHREQQRGRGDIVGGRLASTPKLPPVQAHHSVAVLERVGKPSRPLGGIPLLGGQVERKSWLQEEGDLSPNMEDIEPRPMM